MIILQSHLVNLLHPQHGPGKLAALVALSLETTGHSLRSGSGQRRRRTQIKRSRVGRGRLVLCESPLRLTEECGNYEKWLT